MAYDFDRVIERRHTESSKWRKYGEDVVPLWVADMDFASPEPVIRAMRERVEHGVFGYGYNQERSPLHGLFADRLQKLYGWRVEPDAVVLIPGVIPGFNVACRALTSPGDGVLRSEEHTSELQSRLHLVCRLLLEKKKTSPSAYT